MSEDDSFRDRDWKALFGAGTLFGVLLTMFAISLFSSQGTSNQSVFSALALRSAGDTAVSVSSSDPEYTLRLIQAIGILLPLFTGLLRLTTGDGSKVSESVNRYLFLGILALVLGGSVAVIGGMASDMAGVLRIALGFVLLAFAVIAFAAARMLREMPAEPAAAHEQNRPDDEDTQTLETDREQGESDECTPDGEDEESASAETETEFEDSSAETDQDDGTGDETVSGDGSEQL